MIYTGAKTKNISFPLGGIGTGCIGLAGNGELNDWEIFNRPNKTTRNGYSHFAIKATVGEKNVTKVLHGDTLENLMGTSCASYVHSGFGYGPRINSLVGFPHFKDVTFEGDFPLARLTFTDDEFPLDVRLVAFNPFIPHDEFNSSLPAAFFEWEIKNTASETARVALACTVHNPSPVTRNSKVEATEGRGVFLGSEGISTDETSYSDLCVLTDAPDTVTQEYWYRGNWRDAPTTYWNNLTLLDRMPERSYEKAARGDHGTVVSYTELKAGETAKLRFVIAWNVPTAYNYWTPRKEGEKRATWRNYYATQFEDSFATAKYALGHFETLLDKTSLFAEALATCTLPDAVKDAVSANLSVIKTPTALRLEDGSFWGWEGCAERAGSCFGSCQHVWNYAYAMPYLFPRLERSLRENNIKYGLQDNGATSFRLDLPLKKVMSTLRPCVDGQMGEVIKCYREWKLSGDDAWLKKHAEGIFRMLEFAWSKDNPDAWDADMDGVLEGRQHHTLDLELFGPSAWLEGHYLLALDCGREMAEHLGDGTRACLYKRLYDNGKTYLNEQLFNGRYFYQRVDLGDKETVDRFGAADGYWNEEAKEIKYQVADGCIIDQMLADWHAHLIGKEGVFDPEKKKTALASLYKNNFKSSMRGIANMWRTFSVNDESGTVICSYPDGVHIPAIPISYCEETMTGFEYALAGLMIAEGYVTEGETVVSAIRDRYDGEKRNPWNEIECGSHYARSMASYALMAIYSGFTFDMTKHRIGFAPIGGEGKYVFSACESWGCAEFKDGSFRLSILGNPLTLSALALPGAERIKSVTVDGRAVEFSVLNNSLVFEQTEIHKEMLLK